ncbi:MAG: hypothetical protein PHN44_01875 [Candidatus Marinimicrobia bacterium]|jgi:hypothetical protein|nr:hypothetical protein [Candidatus Neomarinimicrobiota bacterium]
MQYSIEIILILAVIFLYIKHRKMSDVFDKYQFVHRNKHLKLNNTIQQICKHERHEFTKEQCEGLTYYRKHCSICGARLKDYGWNRKAWLKDDLEYLSKNSTPKIIDLTEQINQLATTLNDQIDKFREVVEQYDKQSH